MKRTVKVTLRSGELSQEELHKLAEILKTYEDWQLTGERVEDVSNFYLQVEVTDGSISDKVC